MAILAGTKTAYFGYTGIIEPQGVTRLAAAFNSAVNEKLEEIYLCLSSNGGYLADGIFLYNHIRALPIKTVIHNTGNVSSIAVACFVAADERYCSPHSMFMIHTTTIHANEGMSARRLESSLDAALADDARTEKILRERCSIPDKVLQDRQIDDIHITPDQALKFGLVQEVREFTLPKGNEIIQI